MYLFPTILGGLNALYLSIASLFCLQIIHIIYTIIQKNTHTNKKIIIQRDDIEKIIEQLKTDSNAKIKVSLDKDTEFLISLNTRDNHFNKKIMSIQDSKQKFISNLNEAIRNNIDNPNFSVENLAELLHISRTQLYRKVKSIFNENISDYITNVRLCQAKIMFQDTNLTISEIAYKSGFSSPNYFSTVFKNKYGISPKDFRKHL